MIQAPGLFHPSPIFSSKAGAFPSGTPFEFHSKGRHMALSTNVSLEWKLLTLANTLAYYDSKLNTSVKKFYRTGTSIVLLEVITMSGSSKLLPETIFYFVFRSLATRLWIQTAFRLKAKNWKTDTWTDRLTNGWIYRQTKRQTDLTLTDEQMGLTDR
jgi:hypothetical protein